VLAVGFVRFCGVPDRVLACLGCQKNCPRKWISCDPQGQQQAMETGEWHDAYGQRRLWASAACDGDDDDPDFSYWAVWVQDSSALQKN